MDVRKVNLAEKFGEFQEQWSPKIAGEVNDSFVKLVKFQGDFVWHRHEEEDEMFLVVKGRFTMRFRERDVVLEENEFLIVPKDVEHGQRPERTDAGSPGPDLTLGLARLQ